MLSNVMYYITLHFFFYTDQADAVIQRKETSSFEAAQKHLDVSLF